MKVDKIMQKLSLQKKEDTKEFRGYQRKHEDYFKQMESTKEYREERLTHALHDLRTLTATHVDQVDDTEADYESSYSALSQGGLVDYEVTLKKYDKVCRLIQEMEGKNNKKNSKADKLYQKYLKKEQEYLRKLETCPEWADESYRRMEAQEIAKAKAVALAEQEQELAERERWAQAAREAAQAELELQKKAALAKVRAKAKKQSELDQEKEVAYREAKRLEGNSLGMDAERLVMETRQRGQELEKSFQEQESRGMIRRFGTNEPSKPMSRHDHR